MATPGHLIIHPILAELYRDVESFGRMDPYCVVKVAGHTEKTHIAENMGKHPSWQDRLSFKIGYEEHYEIAVWDRRHMLGDQEIGSAHVSIYNIRALGTHEEWIELLHHGYATGKIRVHATFQPEFIQPAYNPNPVPYGYAPQVIVEENRHHHPEVIYVQQPYGYPQQTEVIIEENRHHHRPEVIIEQQPFVYPSQTEVIMENKHHHQQQVIIEQQTYGYPPQTEIFFEQNQHHNHHHHHH